MDMHHDMVAMSSGFFSSNLAVDKRLLLNIW